MIAYVDSSCMVAIALAERSWATIARRIRPFARLVSSNLLEAELRSALKRERMTFDANLVAGISWVLPDAPLTREIDRVFAAGHVRGADAWHLACALSCVPAPNELTFLTLDQRQRDVAAALGFKT